MRGPRRSTVSRLTVAAILGASCGCAEERVVGDTTVFTFALWVPALVFLACVVATVAGWFLRKKSTRWGWILLIAGPLAGAVVAPGLLLDKVTVNDERFTLHTGFWFAPTAHQVRYGDLSVIEFMAEERRSRRGKRTSYYLLCHKKSGETERVPVGTLMQEGAVIKILDKAVERGVPVYDRT